jgi:hypothetical protein
VSFPLHKYKKETMLVNILLIALIILLIYYYLKSIDPRTKVRAYDGREYLVVDSPSKKGSADALARLNERIEKLLKHLEVHEINGKNGMAVKRLIKKYDPNVLSEGVIDKSLTSFTVNKGEQIVFCLKPRDGHHYQVYDDNLLFYVAMHELGHVMSISEQHTNEFFDNFYFLIENAKKLDLFKHSNKSINYCGLEIPKI